MRNLTFKLLIAVVASIGLLSGCGGGGASAPTANAAQTGSFVLQLRWPSKTRLIPVASQSVVAVLTDANGNLIGAQTLTPPTDGSTLSTATYNNVPIGTVTLKATAYPTSVGTGVPQAVGSATGVVTNGQKTTINVTMADTIVRLVITPADSTIIANTTEQLTMTAYDAANEVVLTSPSTVSWMSSNSDSIGISSTGLVSPGQQGVTTITVTESESGVSGTTTVTAIQNAGDLNGTIQ